MSTVEPPAAARGEAGAAVDLAIGIATYNNAETVPAVLGAAAAGVARHLPGVRAVIVNTDAGSSDGTAGAIAAAGLPVQHIAHDVPPGERVTVPYHGVPGRGAALRAMLDGARRLGARALVVLEADVVTVTPEWIPGLAGPVLEDKADFVTPIYARHRYEGTITRLLMSPLLRALYGRRLQQPVGGQQALSARLVDHLLIHPKWDWRARDASDVWITGTAIADGFAVWESWLGRYAVRSRTRTTDLPAMIAQTLGAAFVVMDRHKDLWLEVRGSEPVPVGGEPSAPPDAPGGADAEALLEGFRLGVRDLGSIWEHILAPDTLGEMLSLDTQDAARFRFGDELWARIVYDFALGHHYGVVHRDHLLRSLVPVYLGKTAAYVTETRGVSPTAVDARLEAVAAAFERQKPYLVEHWR